VNRNNEYHEQHDEVDNAMFTQIEFTNFKGFEKLQLDGLKRVNLVVGKNNSGKTSLLEGIALLANPRQASELPSLLRTTYGDQNLRYFKWLIRDGSAEGLVRKVDQSGTFELRMFSKMPNPYSPIAYFQIGSIHFITHGTDPNLKFKAVSVRNIQTDQLIKAFGSAMRQKNGEEQLERLLRAVDSRIKKIRVDPAPDGNMLVVDIGLSEMVPLHQVGQGVNRLVSILSELIGENAQLCIIDEIENGIHHSALEDVWTGVAEAAAQIGVQVFATTHSYECIEAAHAAFSKRPNYDFSIIQLFRVQNGVQGRVLDQKHIEAAIAGEIDLRGV
jgi:ABC-type transport system involved in cytochrome c biogenesis ATPase subunit